MKIWASGFFPKSFILLVLKFRFVIHFSVTYCIYCVVRVQLHSFACGYPVVPSPFVAKTIVFPPFSRHSCWKSVECKCESLFLYSFLFHWSIYISIICQHNLYWLLYSFVVSFEFGKLKPPNFFFQIVLVIWGSLELLVVFLL